MIPAFITQSRKHNLATQIFRLTRFGRLSRLLWHKVVKLVHYWLLRDEKRCCVGTLQLRLTRKDGSRSRPRSARTLKNPGAATSTSRLSRESPCSYTLFLSGKKSKKGSPSFLRLIPRKRNSWTERTFTAR